ncbi:MAG: hypothetical protein A3K03_05795 [Bdellovibrionales bacterium RIFOXYD1_FULL_44_7]|nr:MAG: hypothetical protein A3K03_05795 [Bdellovibrionales bacterium RIFOXYD1_FULL_44_7]
MNKGEAWRIVIAAAAFLVIGISSINVQAAKPARGQNDNTDSAEELVKQRAEIQKAYESLNTLNPFSETYGNVAPPDRHTLEGQMEQLQTLLSNPAVQGYLKLFTNPAFSRGMTEIYNHPSRMTLLYSEIGLLVFMVLFRAWRLSKAKHWLRKVWVNSYTFVAGWCLALFAVPLLVFGLSYAETMKGILELMIKFRT